MNLARRIQLNMLPSELPVLKDWCLAAFYQPARIVGGDFYDFIEFEDGRLGILIGDVTGKGMPAALLMATTRTLLRAMAQPGVSSGRSSSKSTTWLREILRQTCSSPAFMASWIPKTDSWYTPMPVKTAGAVNWPGSSNCTRKGYRFDGWHRI
jgi:serine phosphatase RsbU (regulator of sigma subunit)